MIVNSINLEKKYKSRYVHPKTHEVLGSYKFLEDGILKNGRKMFLVEGKWIFKTYVPEYRKQTQEIRSSLRGFFQSIKSQMKSKEFIALKRGRVLIGNNEFQDKFNCYDKLQYHYDKQIERHGPRCPITGFEFTFKRDNEIKEKGDTNGIKNMTNLSHDRMLNEYHYTTQNMLFTCMGWNLQRRDFSLKDMSILMREDFFKNYTKILVERFPEKQDEVDQLNELENGAEHPQERR
jgi:hypothetical protein